MNLDTRKNYLPAEVHVTKQKNMLCRGGKIEVATVGYEILSWLRHTVPNKEGKIEPYRVYSQQTAAVRA